MASPAQSGWSKNWKPSGSSVNKKYRCNLYYTITETGKDVTITIHNELEINSAVSASYSGKMWIDWSRYIRKTGTQVKTTTTEYSWSDTAKTTFDSGTKKKTIISEKTVIIQKPYNKSNEIPNGQTLTISAYVSSTTGDWSGQKMTASLEIPLNPRHSFPIEYDANGGTGTVESQLKVYDIPLQLREKTTIAPDGYSFLEWNTKSDFTDDTYLPSEYFYDNTGKIDASTDDERTVLYARYQPADPPTCDYSDLVDDNGYTNPTVFSSLSVTLDMDTLVTYHERSFRKASLTIGSVTTTKTYAQLQNDSKLSVTPNTTGTFNVILRLYDEIDNADGAVNQIIVDTITVVDPMWNIKAEFLTVSYPVPDIDTFGNAIIKVEALNTSTSQYEQIYGDYVIETDSTKWYINVALSKNYVANPALETTTATIKVTYDHSDTYQRQSVTAFYETTRNSNFSNGIYNTMFVSGCKMSNYSSRVWWSQVNNPLYFPDESYTEVGSNDTKVMGLIKVGDYLGAIKQSKTTDTAIYLLYPTSFDEDTTYAVKQGVQGVGALSKYAFNILRDETLFLSPNGVMAITPSGDDEHKVVNRSYFIDGQLLKEQNLDKEAYSFVYNGMYYLAINGVMYVLDGNQRNSWGNDKTNLVYECYYLTNVPANCFAKYNGYLMFTNEHGMCRFKKPDDIDPYIDDYDDFDTKVNVKARWSTVFDDDNSLNYYKTMQKKGNVISILPNVPFKYEPVVITEKEFNKEKTRYYTFQNGDYTRCTKADVYNSETSYFERTKTSTKIYVRKDNKDPVEIERKFNEASDIPSELFVNKKFKKYKRLQFIIENDANEPFGVDEIVKQYTVGNYAKK